MAWRRMGRPFRGYAGCAQSVAGLVRMQHPYSLGWAGAKLLCRRCFVGGVPCKKHPLLHAKERVSKQQGWIDKPQGATRKMHHPAVQPGDRGAPLQWVRKLLITNGPKDMPAESSPRKADRFESE